ncbi:autophagy- protein 2 [Coniosporium apollinis]|uniref:Autophagy-related protein 2 n=2 Tax=Coniosporium TaxID=2810619 RepID=A0ABQ9NGX2_9PEZI|nr:autophagy- protein 2 [Cladosporium sp. JES 115]KAJ9656709.1 autophagy- protein 2 [Coniosporium apollinis]
MAASWSFPFIANLQTRLLRHVLSRLDVLDTDALNDESLEFAWGKTSTIELRKNVSRLLQIPDVLDLREGHIDSLRLTLPVDLHKTGIAVEIKTVNVHAHIAQATNTNRGYTGGSRAKAGGQETTRLPTTQDLAKSFLADEPREEKEELTQALNEQSQQLADSGLSYGDEQDDALGTGTGLSLPGFVSKLLQGILDRLIITITDVNVYLHTNTPADDVVHCYLGKAVVKTENMAKVITLERLCLRIFSDISAEYPRLSTPKPTSSPDTARSPSTSELSRLSRSWDSPTSPVKMASSEKYRGDNLLRSTSGTATPRPTSSPSSPTSPSSLGKSDVIAEHDAQGRLHEAQSPSGDERFADADDQVSSSGLGFSPNFSPAPSNREDLAESRVYDKGEGESMYMSAMSALSGVPSSGGEPRTSVPSEDRTDSERISRINSSASHDPSVLRHVRRVLDVDRLSVSIPQKEESQGASVVPETGDSQLPMQTSFDMTGSSVYQHVPGSFSQYAQEGAGRLRRSSILKDPSKTTAIKTMHPNLSPSVTVLPKAEDAVSATRIDVGPVHIYLDVPTGRLLFGVIQQLQPTASSQNSSNLADVGTDPGDGHHNIAIKLSVTRLSLAWLERFEGALSAQHVTERPTYTAYRPLVLLSSLFEGIEVSLKSASESINANLTIKRLPKLLDSSSDRLAWVGMKGDEHTNDVSLIYARNKRKAELEIRCAPLDSVFDLERLEERLSSCGGLSGVLELGGSFTSSSAGPHEQPPQKAHKKRGVRFDDPADEVISPSLPNLKINLRLSEARLLFTGSINGAAYDLAIHTSAVKVISRPKLIGVSIDMARLCGPFRDDAASVIIEVKQTRTSYLFTPEERHVDQLLALVTPSRDGYEGDDILVDTLVSQRRKGPVLQTEFDQISVTVGCAESLQILYSLKDELAKLSTVAKYLPEDDRPGLLTLAKLRSFQLTGWFDNLGQAILDCKDIQVAHVGLPALLALELGRISLGYTVHNEVHEVLHGAVPADEETDRLGEEDEHPMVRIRFIGGELKPTVRIKLYNAMAEYDLRTIMPLMGLEDDATAEGLAVGLASSVASVAGLSSTTIFQRRSPKQAGSGSLSTNPLRLDIILRDCAVGLQGPKLPSKGIFVLGEATLRGAIPANGDFAAEVELVRASMLLIDHRDNIAEISSASAKPRPVLRNNTILEYQRRKGFVLVASLSNAKALLKSAQAGHQRSGTMEVDVDGALLVVETCADSTQTLIALLSGLAPPKPPNKEQRYRTSVPPVQDMMASFTGDAFEEPAGATGSEYTDRKPNEQSHNQGHSGDHMDESNMYGSFPSLDSLPMVEKDEPALLDQAHDTSTISPFEHFEGEEPLYGDEQECKVMATSIHLEEGHFGTSSRMPRRILKWDSRDNTYIESATPPLQGLPLQLRVRGLHVLWKLYDGYDWQGTRRAIADGIEALAQKAASRRRQPSYEQSKPDTFVEDELMNSIYIAIDPDMEEEDIANLVSRNIRGKHADTVSEISYAMSNDTRSTARPTSAKSTTSSRRFARGKHKLTIQLEDVCADVVVLAPGSEETQSSTDVRIDKLEIIDRLHTSSWNKFLMYQHDVGERELGDPMIHINLLNVRPVPDLAASELVIQVTVLPLRLHVDQDALDFLTRFFDFKDVSATPLPSPKAEEPFLQRVEVNTVDLKIDYKPRRVDYASIRSGHMTEFKNFTMLDGTNVVLRHAIVYGILGFDELHTHLNNLWTQDVKSNQLATVLAGLALLRPLVNVGGGVLKLVEVPMQQYQKDGRLVRSIQKGLAEFARTTTKEIARLGGKVAMGAHGYLHGAEVFLSPTQPDGLRSPRPHRFANDGEWENIDEDASEGVRVSSKYADQPLNIRAGLRGAYKGLERDLLYVQDAIIAIPGEVRESGSAAGAGKVLARHAPTVILRPVAAATQAMGTALLGAANALDKDSRRRMEDKYKRPL